MDQKESQACILTERLVLAWYYGNILFSRIVACHTRSVEVNLWYKWCNQNQDRLEYQKSIFTNDISLILDRKSHE